MYIEVIVYNRTLTTNSVCRQCRHIVKWQIKPILDILEPKILIIWGHNFGCIKSSVWDREQIVPASMKQLMGVIDSLVQYVQINCTSLWYKGD